MRLILDIADQIFPIEKPDVLRAAEIVQSPAALSARDSIHVAVVERYGVKRVFSFDSDVDRWPGIRRIYEI